MSKLNSPSLWLLVLIVGLPQFSETVYTPALPDIARVLHISPHLAEYTLTIYLFAFALGTLFWGKLSDKYGRKPSLLIGFSIYIAGCICCYYALSFKALMTGRFIQAFGGSAGSVLGQVICRDAFTGSSRGIVFSIIGSALAFSPAIGPVIGGLITQLYEWQVIFAFLSVLSLCIMACIIIQLPETYTPSPISLKTILHTAYSMLKNPRVLLAGFIVAACNGINFSYFAEGPFYLITMLGFSPFYYGISFVFFALAGMYGSYMSKKNLDQGFSTYQIMQKGAKIVVISALIFALGIGVTTDIYYVAILLFSCMACMIGAIGMIIPNILSIALEEYREILGTASSIFGFYYYCCISLLTLIMGFLHNGTLLPMPLFFMAIAIALNVALYYLVSFNVHNE